MKRFFQLVSMACLCICFVSCNDEALVETSQPEATGQSFRLIAKQQSPSRLALGEDGMTLYWEAGDKLHLVDKNDPSKHYELLVDLEGDEQATEASFNSQGSVPAGEYHVVNKYNDKLVYGHIPLKSIEAINENEDLVVYGDLKVNSGDTSAEVSLKHLYAKLRVILQNAPEKDSESSSLQIGMYASGKTGFPILKQMTKVGLKNAIDEFNPQLTEYDKYHNLRLTGNFIINKDENQGNVMEYTALVLPANVSDGKLFFYVLDGYSWEEPICYEIEKNGVNFEAGKRYVVNLDLSDVGGAIKTELKRHEAILPGTNHEFSYLQLSTVEECRHAAYLQAYASGQYILMDDIDFSNDVFLPFYAETLLGNNKTISNISLDWSNDDNVGLLRFENVINKTYSPSASIYNLNLENVILKGHSYVGGFGGININADHCHIVGTSSINASEDYVGGIVGMNSFNDGDYIFHGELTNISISDKTTISGNNYVGGIIGEYNMMSSLRSSLISMESCISSATVNASGNYVGGIVGRIGYHKYKNEPFHIYFESESQTYSLKECVNNGQVKGMNYVGGIVGDFAVYTNSEGKDRVVIKQSANEGEIIGVNYVGGITGRTCASINNCYSVNEITATVSHVGGITGDVLPLNNGRIANCYSLADISVGMNGYAGGIVGYGSGGAQGAYVINSYFAGTNPNGFGIIGHSDGFCFAINCLTTLSSLIGNLNQNTQFPDDITGSLTNVTSIKNNKSVINGESAYSDDIWPLEKYPAYCIKFSTGLSGNITIPGFSDEEIVI